MHKAETIKMKIYGWLKELMTPRCCVSIIPRVNGLLLLLLAYGLWQHNWLMVGLGMIALVIWDILIPLRIQWFLDAETEPPEPPSGKRPRDGAGAVLS